MIELVEKIVLPPAHFLENAAERIVSRHLQALPNLSQIQIVAAPRVANGLRQALAKAASKQGVTTLLLPQIATLNELAARQPAAAIAAIRVVPTSERVLDIFQVLKKQRWFSAGETLALSRELVQLADELTSNLVVLPKSLDEHSRNLARAYQISKQNGDFSLEARLTYDVWQLLAKPSIDSIDAPARYALQLSSWAAGVVIADRQPIYVIGSHHFTGAEMTFLERYGSVMFLDQQLAGCETNRARFIAAALCGAPGFPKVAVDTSAIGVSVAIECYAALDVEDEACAALATIKRWLDQGKREIAVVALDRLAARRLRALAERDLILMSDEIGWPYSTTVSATAIMAWLEAKRDGFHFETLIDLIKSPFIFADLNATWGRERVKAASLQIERAIRRAGVVAGLVRVREAVIQTAAASNAPTGDTETLLGRLITADREFTNARRNAAEWIDALFAVLTALGLDIGLRRDAAGAGLLGHLKIARDDIAACTIKLSASEWTDWLRALMEEARFRDAAIDSPVVMTSLDATRFRSFDGVILLGASDSNLPGKPLSTGIFNQSVRRSLGLKTFSDSLAHITSDLVGVLNRSDLCWISWQKQAGAEPQNPSPWVAALRLHAKRVGVNLMAKKPPIATFASQRHEAMIVASTAAATDAVAEHTTYAAAGSAARRFPRARPGASLANPAPVLGFEQVPRKISASAYQSLIDCPYQYFSRAVLRLREPDDVQEEMEKRDFGEFVHDILNRFHHRFPVLTGLDNAELKAALIAESAAVFSAAPQQNFTARAWRLQWESALDDYLKWQLDRERTGWRWRDGEVKAGFPILLENGERIQLEGRIDRVDDKWDTSADANESAVIDYKARPYSALSKKLKEPGEDVQLPVYVALLESLDPARKVVEASYLSIERQSVRPASYPDAESSGQHHVMRLQNLFEAMFAGRALPAQGIDSACQFCEARGLCRRDYWVDNTGQDGDE